MERTKKDIVKDIVFFILTTAFSFGYWMLMWLIISFVTSSYIPFSIEGIWVLAILCTIVVDIMYIVKKVKEYKKTLAKS